MSGSPPFVVMYHHVRPQDSVIPNGIRPILLPDFEGQLDRLSESHDIVSPAEAVAGRSRRPSCVLTFDDGTRDHADVVLPVLRRRGITGVFFLLSGPWLTAELPTAQRVHLLLSSLDDVELWSKVREAALGLGLDEDALGTAEAAECVYHHEDSYERRRIKYAVNFALPKSAVDEMLGALIAEHVGDEASLVGEWFLSQDDARALHGAGMTIAAHGHSHTALARLSPDALEAEIRSCHETLSNVTGVAPEWFAPPFGGAGARVETLERLDRVLDALGYKGVFVIGDDPGPHAGARRLPRIARVDAAALFDRDP